MKDFEEARREVALGYALKHGSLERCDDCNDVTAGSGSRAEAIANALRDYNNGHISDMFENKAQVQQVVWEVISDYPTDDCHCHVVSGHIE